MTDELSGVPEHMSNDSRLKWSLIGCVVLLDVLLVASMGLTFPWPHIFRPLIFGTLLAAVGMYYHRRGVPTFVLCMVSLLHLVLFTSGYTVLMYSIAATGRPFADAQLMAFDHACGVHLPDIVQWATAHPTITRLLRVTYDTLLFQTAGLVIVLGFLGDRRALQTYILRFMVAALVTAGFFWWAPAEGPFVAYGYAPSDDQVRYLDHLHGLRSGTLTTVTWVQAEGLITFPSFHTTWAILLALAVRHRRWLFVFLATVNTAVVVSTLTTGWHYASDVIAGIVTCAFAVAVSHALEPWLYPSAPEEPCVSSGAAADLIA
jgi:hypothetical protein